MQRDQAYQKAIELLTGDIDYKAVAINLAKADPHLFIECVEQTTSELAAYVRENYVEGNKWCVIKYVRSQTGWGKKEAKSFCERHELHEFN